MKTFNYFVALLVIFLLLTSTVFAVHCRELLPAGTSFTAQASFQGCHVSASFDYNGKTYTTFATPDAKLLANGFGSYNFHCTDGDAASRMNYVRLNLDSTSLYNSSAGSAIMGDIPYCKYVNGVKTDDSMNYGFGDQSQILAPLIEYLGGHTYSVEVSHHPIGGTYTSEWGAIGTSTNFFVGLPSMSVFSETDLTKGFYENFGTYDKNILFTLLNKSVFNNTIKSYTIGCSGNLTCAVKQGYNDYTINALNGKMIIPGAISVNKNGLPLTGTVWLDVNYLASDLDLPGCTTYLNNTTQSKPESIKLGMLDEQDFQVEIKAAMDQTGCIGENGMIGQTGEAYAPRINSVFGGKTTANQEDNTVAVDECDAKTIAGADNPNAVYCSQKEFIVELGRKIAQAVKANDAERFRYLSFDIYVRDQELTAEKIGSSIDGIAQASFISHTGLEGTSDFDTADLAGQRAKLHSLFNSVEFVNMLDLRAGLYHVSIEFNDLYPIGPTTTLFAQGTNEVDQGIKPKINITLKNYPYFNWPLYSLGYVDNIDASITKVPLTNETFNETNNLHRGSVLEIINQTNAPPEMNLYKTFAVPLFIKLSGSDNNSTDSNFIVVTTSNTGTFTYWTAFASSLGGGCQTIANTAIDTTLPYRLGDELTATSSTTVNKVFEIPGFASVKANQTIYFDTVLFLPKIQSGNDEGISLKVPFKAYTKDNNYLGTNNNLATININSSYSNFKIGDSNGFESIVSGIKSGNICVYKGINEGGKMQFTVFWNQQEVLRTLNDKKNSVISTSKDANICPIRAIN